MATLAQCRRTPRLSLQAPRFPPPDRARVDSEKYCGFGSIVGSPPDKSELLTIPVRCKSWTCKICAPRKTRAILARLLRGEPQRDITLTMRANIPGTARMKAAMMKKAASRVFTKARKTFGVFEYAAVMELTKKGTPHMHILQRGTYIPVAWLKREWKKHGLGHVVHIQKIRSARHAAGHAVKYLGKAFGQTACAIAPLHLVQFSNNYELDRDEDTRPQDKPRFLWTHTMEHVDSIARRFLACSRYLAHVHNDDGSWSFTLRAIDLPEYADVSDPTYILDSTSRGPPALELPTLAA